ncbi:hypothetical protein BB559_003858 [Furculomyces boomerangus]|uniref:Protein kinase domain-containing protein n=1 Tax=Furculomyces boomerangus TaxID=61424 RepID=A0A2T9YIC9_9FUNG|nr:hypothetical protein BB559_003858 [Furculomyces boomerangus]
MDDDFQIKYTFATKALEEDEGGIEQLNQYKFQKELGHGGSGVVYLAKDIITKTEYASPFTKLNTLNIINSSHIPTF